MIGRKPSDGMGQIPPAFETPVLADRFFWLFVGTILFWAILFVLIF